MSRAVMLCHCGAKLENLWLFEAVERENMVVTRRTYRCNGPEQHKVRTFEIPESAWKVAQHDIQKAVKGQAYHRKIAARARLAAEMRLERERGVSCPDLAKKYGMSVDMVRYYTRMPRERLYPAVKKRKAIDGNQHPNEGRGGGATGCPGAERGDHPRAAEAPVEPGSHQGLREGRPAQPEPVSRRRERPEPRLRAGDRGEAAGAAFSQHMVDAMCRSGGSEQGVPGAGVSAESSELECGHVRLAQLADAE